MIGRTRTWASFVRLEHTLFSLPVLFGGAVLAASGWPPWPRWVWIGVAGTGARTLAMALNRIIDRQIDSLNPRTAARELPSGSMSLVEAWAVAGVGALVYLVACLYLPPICLRLAPIPVVVFAGYPLMKRFTPLAHFGVGTALALAPIGAWLAVRGGFEGAGPALWLSGFTLLWVAGFDIIYATLDEQFDRRQRLQSLPARLGTRRALAVSAGCHVVAVGTLVVLYVCYLHGAVAATMLVAVAATLLAEQRLAKRVDLAFFRLNLLVGFLVIALVMAGI